MFSASLQDKKKKLSSNVKLSNMLLIEQQAIKFGEIYLL